MNRSILLGLNTLTLVIVTTTTINNFDFNLAKNNSMMVNAQEITSISYAGFGRESQQPQQPGEYTAGTIASIQNDKGGISK